MIVTVVRFQLTEPVSLDDARDQFGSNAASYLDVPGLLFKAYLRGENGETAGGAYWWADRASAEAKFNADWLAGVTAKYGAPPSIEYFDAPVIVDAQHGVIRTEPPLLA
ncbi:MAG: YdhR family protein [Acidimicrobiales bacterium]